MGDVHVDGLRLIEHRFEVPLDHAGALAERLVLFAREVVPAGAERARLPMLVYLQGGPGGMAPRPRARDGWLAAALEAGYRVLLLDQRGTGSSSPIDARALPTDDDDALAERLERYRADAIVADAELVRRHLLGEDGRWTVLGQSYGGFLALHYLSVAPDHVEGVLVTGGLPSLDRPAIDVYRATFEAVERRTRAYLERYPGDAALLLELLERAGGGDHLLPDGGALSEGLVRRLGFQLGNAHGFEVLHEALELAFTDVGAERRLTSRFLYRLLSLDPFRGNPIFAVLHEAIYAQGEATAWAAERALAERASAGRLSDEPWLTGEMVFRSTLDDVPALAPFRGAALRLARKADWPRLYDLDTLRRNRVPVAALVYVDDLYVPLAWSQETVERVGSLRAWITNEYHHDGIHRDGGRILGRLLELMRS